MTFQPLVFPAVPSGNPYDKKRPIRPERNPFVALGFDPPQKEEPMSEDNGTKKGTRVTDKELRAMANIATTLDLLDERTRGRVVDWVIDRYPSPTAQS